DIPAGCDAVQLEPDRGGGLGSVFGCLIQDLLRGSQELGVAPSSGLVELLGQQLLAKWLLGLGLDRQHFGFDNRIPAEYRPLQSRIRILGDPAPDGGSSDGNRRSNQRHRVHSQPAFSYENSHSPWWPRAKSSAG